MAALVLDWSVSKEGDETMSRSVFATLCNDMTNMASYRLKWCWIRFADPRLARKVVNPLLYYPTRIKMVVSAG